MTEILLDGITLPGDLYWSDEFTSWKVGQAVKPSLTGAQVVHEGVRQSGRPISLETTDDGDTFVAWVSLDVLRALQASEETPDRSFPLVLPAHNGGTRSFDVAWRRTDGPAVEARPVRHIVPALNADVYAITLRLMTV